MSTNVEFLDGLEWKAPRDPHLEDLIQLSLDDVRRIHRLLPIYNILPLSGPAVSKFYLLYLVQAARKELVRSVISALTSR